jgi:heat shock protein HslJ
VSRLLFARVALLVAALLAGCTAMTPAPAPPPLHGTSWRVTAIDNGKGAVSSVLGGSTVTLSFAAGGLASGSAGCNRFSARYEAEGVRLRITAPATTRMMCATAELMEQERAFLQALQSAASMHFEGERLELRRADGALAIALLREGGAAPP